MKVRFLILAFIFPLFVNLTNAQSPLFRKLDPAETGLRFTNTIVESDSLHVMKYEYLYNGHGAGVGDFNGDGLEDLFISGNTSASRLFLNQGKFRFKDVTQESGIQYNGTWATGVAIVDINGDGRLDIYLCHSGSFQDSNLLRNELFINTGLKNGIPQFKDSAKEYGLDAPGTQSTQALFFDYDRDGDLDMFLLNHSNHTYNPFLNTRKIRSTPDMRFGNRLFRNDRNMEGIKRFTDVTIGSGIVNNALNFGLGIAASDLNGDGWVDLYTTSDYTEKDNLYINNRKGKFIESISKSMPHISKYSMGVDISDYNNDGLPDVYTLDMLPSDNRRQKLLKGPDEYDQYHLLIDSGYYRQQMRNMLHLHQGNDGNGDPRFSEIGQFAGVSNTDWSWAGLFADFDNDGWKDLFVSNGYLRDFTDMDFLKYTVSNVQMEEAKKGNFNFKTVQLVSKMPSNKLSSYVFQNAGLRFIDKSKEWGIDEPAISNGAVYADFDNDGFLDLLICRNNEPVALYQNTGAGNKEKHFIGFRLHANSQNTMAVGAKLWIYSQGQVQMQELFPVRGYQSSVTNTLHFGIASSSKLDSARVRWPDGTVTLYGGMIADSVYQLEQGNARPIVILTTATSKLFSTVPGKSGIDYVHKENDFIDFKDEVLLPYQLSREGPSLAKADVNGDGWDDLFIGGAIDQAGVLYLQDGAGKFVRSPSQPWTTQAASEDVNAIFVDVNNDKHPDLYVVSGGNEYSNDAPEYSDRLYLNDGKGNFTMLPDALPEMLTNKKAIAAADFDRDGDIDLFVGGRVVPGSFPLPARSYLLRNDSRGDKIKFTDVTKSVESDLLSAGMLTSATWDDLNNDGYPELIIAGEWMPVKIYNNQNGKLSEAKDALKNSSGLWSAMRVLDIDNDGDKDIVLGNAGTNLQFTASAEQPMTMVAEDFDGNGRIDPIISYYIHGKSYPMASRDELLDQLNGLRKKFVYYKDYADTKVEDIFSRQQLSKAETFKCEQLQSGVYINNGNLGFSFLALPDEAQFSRINSILSYDVDKDGKNELIVSGNFYPYRVQLGPCNASFGLVVKVLPGNKFRALRPFESGLYSDGDVRNAEFIRTPSDTLLIISKNNSAVQVEKLK